MLWSSIPSGNFALCFVGAGFPIGILNDPPPSTGNLLQKAANNYPNEYPILNEIIGCNRYPNLTLYQLWSNIDKFACSVAYAYPKIFAHYMGTTSNMKEFFIAQSKNGRSPENILWIGLGLELKKAISQFYHIPNKGNFNLSKINNVRNIISNFGSRCWASLNYDLVLEEALFEIIPLNGLFNGAINEVRYLNEEFLDQSMFRPKNSSKDLIIKPHGSINISFETDYGTKTHLLVFVDPLDYFQCFDHTKIGYEKKGASNYESRPCIIGYVPDDFKDELNSKSYFSDIAHDFCKMQMASITFAMNQADSIFILGYSMPKEDEWIWKRMKDAQNKNVEIIICSHSDSQRIENDLKSIGFSKTSILNAGII